MIIYNKIRIEPTKSAVLSEFDLAVFRLSALEDQDSQLILSIFRSSASPVTLGAMSDAFAQQTVKPFQST
ncbi:MAG: hypothetical protein ACREIF_00960 [Chthoniobacterales bacterium]